MSTPSRDDRSKTQVEVFTATRKKLRLLAALTDQGMAEAADEAISRCLAQVQEEQA